MGGGAVGASETTEQRLDRMFKGMTDPEVTALMEDLRDPGTSRDWLFELVWREYARRKYGPLSVTCGRCGSENHVAENHAEMGAR